MGATVPSRARAARLSAANPRFIAPLAERRNVVSHATDLPETY
jgi:hypothetical protein